MFLIPCKATGLGIYLAFHSVEREPQRIHQHAVFQVQAGTGAVNSSLPGIRSPPTRLPNFPCFRGVVLFSSHSSKCRGVGRGEEVVERHSGPPWEKPGVRALGLLATVCGGKPALEAQGPLPPSD